MKVLKLLPILLLTSAVLFAQSKKPVKANFSIIGCWSATEIGDGSEYHFYADKHFSLVAPTKSVRGTYEYIGDIVILHFKNEYNKPDHDETLRLARYGNTKLLGSTTTVDDVRNFFGKGTCNY